MLAQIAQEYSKALGRTITYQDIPVEPWRDALLDAIQNAIERSRTALGHEAEVQALRNQRKISS